ncbi:hypothetical protein GCM10028895_25260 [Pontibacter rugosus]
MNILPKLWYIGALLLMAFCSLGKLAAQNLKKEFPQTLTVAIKNPLNQQRNDVMVLIKKDDLLKLAPSFNPEAFVVLDGKKKLPASTIAKTQIKKALCWCWTKWQLMRVES